MTKTIFKQWLEILKDMIKKRNQKIVPLVDNSNQSPCDKCNEQSDSEIPYTQSNICKVQLLGKGSIQAVKL
jgi:Mrp family chromosome partitioning ATPase